MKVSFNGITPLEFKNSFDEHGQNGKGRSSERSRRRGRNNWVNRKIKTWVGTFKCYRSEEI